jgi:hypothetical protein
MKSIAWLVIGTNNYLDLALHCLDSIRSNYCGRCTQSFLLLTDRASEVVCDWIDVCPVKHEKFPYISLRRYEHFVNLSEKLLGYTYTFYVDADMEFINVGDEILSKRVVVSHAAFYDKPSVKCSFDRNINSKAYVPYDYEGPYFQNCFQGGITDDFLKMSRRLSRRIQYDINHDQMALWHDESHMNWYMAKHPPTLILDPGYAYPWWKDVPFQQKIKSIAKSDQNLRVN